MLVNEQNGPHKVDLRLCVLKSLADPRENYGSFTPEIYYAIAISLGSRMGCAPILAIRIHHIEKNRNHIRNCSSE